MIINLFGYCINIFKYKDRPHVVSSCKVMRDNLNSRYLVLTDKHGIQIPCQRDLTVTSNLNQPPIATVTIYVNLDQIKEQAK